MSGIQWVLNKYLLNEWMNNYSVCYGSAQSKGEEKNGLHTAWVMIRKDILEEVMPESILKHGQKKDFWWCPVIYRLIPQNHNRTTFPT